MNSKRYSRVTAGFLAAMVILTGCSGQTGADGKNGLVRLDPDHPVNLTVWHYYNGVQQIAFDKLVEEFNNTKGRETGIFVTGHSQGNVTQLEESVLKAMNKEVGSEEAPNIFSCYADTAREIEKMGALADLSPYVTDEELSTYVDSYIEEGRIGQNGEFMIFPTAKSSEIFMLNKTDWDKFAAATGASLDNLATKEGLVETAQTYYEWTDSLTPDIPEDGKAFYGRDSMANLFIIGSMELGTEIFQVENQKVTMNIDRDVMKRLWDFYYVPYIKGYFCAYGRFRSDDAKTGDLISYTGSTTSALYFPKELHIGDETYPIDYAVMPVPKFEGGENYAVQQGAGMVVTKKSPEEVYASVVFLKWFTQKENNISFGCGSGYLPVKKDASSREALDQVIKDTGLEVEQVTYDTLITAFDIAKNNTLYTNKAFDGGTGARKILDYDLADKAAADREAVKERLAGGESLDEAVAGFVTEEEFDKWFQSFSEKLRAVK